MQSVTKQLKNGSGKIELTLPATADILEINNPLIDIDRDRFDKYTREDLIEKSNENLTAYLNYKIHALHNGIKLIGLKKIV